MPKEYCLGPDELSFPSDLVWVVYHYEDEGWEGSGEYVALREDGKVETDSLSHCSCYGPLEDRGDIMTVEQFLEPSALHGCVNSQVEAKAIELLTGKSEA